MEENQNNQNFNTNQMPNNQGFNAYNQPNNNQGANPNYSQNMNQNFNFNQNNHQTINETKGFFSGFFKDPIGKISDVSTNFSKNFIKFAVIIMVAWVVLSLINHIVNIADTYLFTTYSGLNFSRFFRNLFGSFTTIFATIKSVISPVITVALLSLLIFLFNKKKNKSFIAVATSVLVSQIPVVLSYVVDLFSFINSGFLRFTSAFSGICSVLSTVLLYFATKELLNEGENKSFFWKFAAIIAIYYVVRFILQFLGFYI
jgi:hypothetical protein